MKNYEKYHCIPWVQIHFPLSEDSPTLTEICPGEVADAFTKSMSSQAPHEGCPHCLPDCEKINYPFSLVAEALEPEDQCNISICFN